MLFLLLLAFACTSGSESADKDSAESVACGTLTCAGGALCQVEQHAATCTNRDDTGTPCPDGTTESMCGGDGHPCCCEPAPADTYACVDGAGCGDTPSCDCVSCPGSKQCSATGEEFTFVCTEPAMP